MFLHATLSLLILAAARLIGCAGAPPSPLHENEAPIVQDEDGGPVQEMAGQPAEAGDDVDSITVEELLDKLEAAAADLESFQANIRHRQTDAVFGGVTTTTGRVIYSIHPDSDTKRFAILFKQEIKDGTLRAYNVNYIFDGEWLVEKNFDNKSFIKRQIVAPGDEFDPLKLGEGPFPIPIGQKKADVLTRFEVEVVDPPAGDEDFLASELGKQPVWGLSLVPKPGTPEAKDFEKVTVYYDRETLLPAGIDIRKTQGEHEQVLLLARVRNGAIDESVMDTSVPESGWRVDIRPWREGE